MDGWIGGWWITDGWVADKYLINWIDEWIADKYCQHGCMDQTCLARAELVSWIQRHLTTCPHLTRKNIILTGMEEI